MTFFFFFFGFGFGFGRLFEVDKMSLGSKEKGEINNAVGCFKFYAEGMGFPAFFFRSRTSSPCVTFPFTQVTFCIIQERSPLVENGHPPVRVRSSRSNDSRTYSVPLPCMLVGPTSAIR